MEEKTNINAVDSMNYDSVGVHAPPGAGPQQVSSELNLTVIQQELPHNNAWVALNKQGQQIAEGPNAEQNQHIDFAAIAHDIAELYVLGVRFPQGSSNFQFMRTGQAVVGGQGIRVVKATASCITKDGIKLTIEFVGRQ